MEAVEAQNSQHEQIVANMTPEEARRMLEEQDAKHREQMEGQLRLLEGQMREAAAVAREMEESGMEADHEAMLKDLEDLRALAKSLGASITEDQADLVPLRTKHKKMRGAGGVMEATKGPLEARMQQLMSDAIKTVEAVEAQNSQHEQIVANMTPEEARQMLEEQDAKHREQMEGQLRLLEGQMTEAAAIASELQAAGRDGPDVDALMADLEELRLLAASLGAQAEVRSLSLCFDLMTTVTWDEENDNYEHTSINDGGCHGHLVSMIAAVTMLLCSHNHQ